MFLNHFIGQRFITALVCFVLAATVTAPAEAQVKEVVVGLTPTCPYGFPSCWGGAAEALRKMEGVTSVTDAADVYNSTATVFLEKPSLPDVKRWREQFNKSANEAYVFRGIELTIQASVVQTGGKLQLKSPTLQDAITLAPLKNKVQWNFKKFRPRQPEPDEQTAYDELVRRLQGAGSGSIQATVTGPLQESDAGPVLEVREYFVLSDRAKSAPK